MPFVIFILGFLIFSQTTSEFMIAGIMPSLSEAFGVSIGAVGYLISAYAAGMIIGGPILTVALLKISLKKGIMALTVVFLIGQTVAALAGSYEVMMVARIVQGIASSATFGTAMSISYQLVPEHLRARAASIVLGGLMIATALGVPFAMALNLYLGWRASFWAIVVLVLIAAICVHLLVPAFDSQNDEEISIKKEISAFKNYRLWAAYTTNVFIIGATFAAFSYFTPILTEITGFSSEIVPVILAVYGVATVIGNIFVGWLADSYMILTMVLGLFILTGALILFVLFTQSAVISVISVIIIGLTGVSLNPAMAKRVLTVSNTGTLVATMNNSMINVGLMIGSSIGGFTIGSGFGLTSPLWVGIFLAGVGLITLLPAFQRGFLQVNE